MACRMNSGLYAVNTAQGTSISNGGIYAPVTIIQKRGCNVSLTGNGFQIDSGGCSDVFYDIDISASLEGLAATTPVTITLNKDGVPVTGMTATETVTAANDIVNLSLSGTVKVKKCSESVFTITVIGQNTESYNLSVKVRMV